MTKYVQADGDFRHEYRQNATFLCDYTVKQCQTNMQDFPNSCYFKHIMMMPESKQKLIHISFTGVLL